MSPKFDYILCTTVPCLCAADSLEKNMRASYQQASMLCVEVDSNGRVGGEQATSAMKDYCMLNEYTIPAVEAIQTTSTKKGPTATAKKSATAAANPTSAPDAEGEPLPDESDPAPTTTAAPAKDDGLSTGVIIGIAVSAVGIIIASKLGVISIIIAVKYGKAGLGQAVRHPIQFWRTGPMETGVVYYDEGGMGMSNMQEASLLQQYPRKYGRDESVWESRRYSDKAGLEVS